MAPSDGSRFCDAIDAADDFPGFCFDGGCIPLLVSEGGLGCACSAAAVAVWLLARRPLVDSGDFFRALRDEDVRCSPVLSGGSPFISFFAFASALPPLLLASLMLALDFVDFEDLAMDCATLLFAAFASPVALPFSSFVSASCFRNFAISSSLSGEGRVEACAA